MEIDMVQIVTPGVRSSRHREVRYQNNPSLLRLGLGYGNRHGLLWDLLARTFWLMSRRREPYNWLGFGGWRLFFGFHY